MNVTSEPTNSDDIADKIDGADLPGIVPPPCPLEEVLRTDDLMSEGSRPPNYELENEGLTLLMEALVDDPRKVLAKLVEVAQRVCQADAAGVSIKEGGVATGEEGVFRWVATAGNLAPFLNNTLPGDFSPCGETIKLRSPQVMVDPVRYYPYIGELPFHIGEVLLVPFFKKGVPVGTVWVTLTHETRRFDREDLRLVTNLSKFAAAACETMIHLNLTEETMRKYREVALKMEVALEAGSIATWTWYVDTNRVYADTALMRLFALTEEEANGGPLELYLDAILPEDRPRVEAQIAKSLAERGSYQTEYRLRHPDGSLRWVEARGRMLKDSGPEPVLSGVLVDITRQKINEEALRIACDEAVALSHAKDDFLAALSHELRTPLNPVLLLASAAAGNKELPEKVREDFESIRQNVELEARLIDDLLDLTRLAHGKMVLEKKSVSVHDVLKHSWDKVEAIAQDKQIALGWQLGDIPDMLEGDPVRLQQVFWNLLNNAVKFTPAGGKIAVSSELSADGESIVIQVSDNGLGIHANQFEVIFDEFSQGSHDANEVRKSGGLGLGLAISKRLVQLHGGTIQAESEGLHMGATFITKLPLLKHAAEERSLSHDGDGSDSAAMALEQDIGTGSNAEAAASGAGTRILLVEDHAMTRDVILRLLTRKGFVVKAAPCGEDALEIVRSGSFHFDLVLSDLGLPDMSGYTLLERLKELKPTVIGIALSGYGTERDVEESRVAGFAEHLTKPISLPDLEQAIGRVYR